MNPCDGYPPYSLSRGASSPLEYFSIGEHSIDRLFALCLYGGGEGIRTLGSCESLVFKTSSLNHSDTPPNNAMVVIIARIVQIVNAFSEKVTIINFAVQAPPFIGSQKSYTIRKRHTPKQACGGRGESIRPFT